MFLSEAIHALRCARSPLMRIDQVGELFDVLDETEQQPLSVDLALAA